MSGTFKLEAERIDDAITLEDAKGMIKEYSIHPERLKQANGKDLFALELEADDIRAMENMDKALIIFAVRKEDVSNDTADQHFTNILAGVKDGKIQTTKLRNMFAPCPNNCPSDFYTTFDLPEPK